MTVESPLGTLGTKVAMRGFTMGLDGLNGDGVTSNADASDELELLELELAPRSTSIGIDMCMGSVSDSDELELELVPRSTSMCMDIGKGTVSDSDELELELELGLSAAGIGMACGIGMSSSVLLVSSRYSVETVRPVAFFL